MNSTEKALIQEKNGNEEKDKLAIKYIDFYRRAHQNMERLRIYEKLKKCHLYWKGEQNKPESDFDPASNVNVIHPMVEGNVSLLVEENISVKAAPVTFSDAPFSEKASSILEFIKSRNHMKKVIERHERGREKYGMGVIRVIFDMDALGGAGLPKIENVPIQNILIDPCVTDVLKINEAEFIIERIVKSVYWAKETYGEEVAAQIQENYFPFRMDDVSDESKSDGENAKYEHLLIWTREAGMLRLVEMSGCGVILSDSEDSGEGFYKAGGYPYFFTPLYEDEGTIFGIGDIEITAPVQDIINDLDDQIRINARLTGNPQRLIETGSGIDLDALTNEAGLNIPVNHVGAVKNLEAPQLPSYVERRRNLALQYEVQKVSRFSDQMTGNKQTGVDTATEALTLQQSGNSGIAHKKSMLQDTLADVFSYAFELVREFWDRDIVIRIDDEGQKFITVSPMEFEGIDNLIPKEKGGKHVLEADGTKNAEFDITVSVGAGLPQNKAFQYNMMRELYAMKIISAEELREWMNQNFGLALANQQPSTPGEVPGGEIANQNADVLGVNMSGNIETGAMM